MKTLAAFHTSKNTRDGVRGKCKDCTNAQSAAYRAAHAAEIAASKRAWMERNPDRVKQYARGYRARHAEEYRAASRERHARNAEARNAHIRAWKKANPEKVRGYTLARIARLRGAPGSHTLRDWQALCARFDFKCAYCGITPPVLTRDHVIPLSRGGSDFIGNILPACSKCNCSKQDKTIMEWRVSAWQKATVDTADRPTRPPLAGRAALAPVQMAVRRSP